MDTESVASAASSHASYNSNHIPTVRIKREPSLGHGPRVPPPPPFCEPAESCCNPGSCEDGELNQNGRVRSSCEACAKAKVRCSGEIPCKRCTKKGFECEYKIEKKRGRRRLVKDKEANLCSDASCWGQVVMNPFNKCEDFGAKFGLESVERRLFQTFFAIYKHHATPQSCCREWFTYQLNKMSTFLVANGNPAGQEKLDAWMKRKGIAIMRRDPQDYSKVPANVVDEVSGRLLPPIHPLKGPKMLSEEARSSKRKRNPTGEVFSNRGFYVEGPNNSPVDDLINQMRSKMCFINLRSTHEQFEVEVNDDFTALFGYTTHSLVNLMERLFGGLLPWGCDLLALLLSNDHDLLFLMRIIALKFNSIGRPAEFPATRQAITSHVFEFDTKAGDVVECILHCVHREFLSMDRTEVDIYFGLQPMFTNVPRKFQDTSIGEKKRVISNGSGGVYTNAIRGQSSGSDSRRSAPSPASQSAHQSTPSPSPSQSPAQSPPRPSPQLHPQPQYVAPQPMQQSCAGGQCGPSGCSPSAAAPSRPYPSNIAYNNRMPVAQAMQSSLRQMPEFSSFPQPVATMHSQNPHQQQPHMQQQQQQQQLPPAHLQQARHQQQPMQQHQQVPLQHAHRQAPITNQQHNRPRPVQHMQEPYQQPQGAFHSGLSREVVIGPNGVEGDLPENDLEGLDFLDSMISWAGDDLPSVPAGSDTGQLEGPLGNMSIRSLSSLSDFGSSNNLEPMTRQESATSFSATPGDQPRSQQQRSCALDLLPPDAPVDYR